MLAWSKHEVFEKNSNKYRLYQMEYVVLFMLRQ
jgi:hypothetical protein